MLGPDVQMMRTDYDFESAADRIRRLSWSNANEFAEKNVISVPSREGSDGLPAQGRGGSGRVARQSLCLNFRKVGDHVPVRHALDARSGKLDHDPVA